MRFKTIFYYFVMTLEIIHPITFWNYKKHPSKKLQNKITSCNHATFLQTVFRTLFSKKNLPEIQDK